MYLCFGARVSCHLSTRTRALPHTPSRVHTTFPRHVSLNCQPCAGEGKGAGKKGGGKGKSPKQVRLESNSDYMNRWLSDLPVMSESHAPESEEWSNSFAVCSIMRNENLSDVMEWLRYYKCAS